MDRRPRHPLALPLDCGRARSEPGASGTVRRPQLTANVAAMRRRRGAVVWRQTPDVGPNRVTGPQFRLRRPAGARGRAVRQPRERYVPAATSRAVVGPLSDPSRVASFPNSRVVTRRGPRRTFIPPRAALIDMQTSTVRSGNRLGVAPSAGFGTARPSQRTEMSRPLIQLRGEAVPSVLANQRMPCKNLPHHEPVRCARYPRVGRDAETAGIRKMVNGGVTARCKRWSRGALAYALLGAAYGASGAAGAMLLRGVDNRLWSIAPHLAVPWLPTGIGVAGLIVGGTRLWPAIFVASVVIWVAIVRLPWFAGLADAAAITAAYVVTVRLMTRWGFGRRFDRYQDPLLLVAAAAAGMLIVEAVDLLSVPITATLFPASMSPDLWTLVRRSSAGILIPTTAFLGTALRWWLNEMAGVVLVVPAVASLSPQFGRGLKTRRHEFVFWLLSVGLWVIGGLNLQYGEARPLFLVTGLVIVVWAAVRFGVTSASLATLLCSVLATSAFLRHRGPFATMSPSEGLAALWGFICVLTAIGLFLAVLLAERERVTRELRRSEERLSHALQVADIGIFDHDHTTGLIFWSSELRRMFGFAEQEPITYDGFLECVVPDDRRAISQATRRLNEPASGGHVGIEYRVNSRDGKLRCLLVHAETHFSASDAVRVPLRTVGAVLDITDRRAVEDSLRASQRRLAEAQRLGSMGSWEFDFATRRLVLSDEAARIFEAQGSSAPDEHEPYLYFAHPDDREFIRSSFRDCLDRRETASELTHRLRVRDGQIKFVTERWETVYALDGSPRRMTGTVQDITQRRRLEAEAVEATVLERRRLASELHDNLGQLLFSASLLLTMFLQDVVEKDPTLGARGEAIRGSLAEALEVCRRVAHSAEPVVDGGLGAALQNLTARNTTASVRCEAQVSTSVAAAIMPSQSLELFRIAQEAITNALKHSQCARIEVRLRALGPIVELAIEDDGNGMPPPERRGADGLGMRTMRYRAERAGGTLTVVAGRHGGTMVRVLVPRQATT
jgi:PAS domain S-box-containing protein